MRTEPAGAGFAEDADLHFADFQMLAAALGEIDVPDQEVGAAQDGVRLAFDRGAGVGPAFDADQRHLAAAALVGVPFETRAGLGASAFDWIHRAALGALDPDPFEPTSAHRESLWLASSAGCS